MQCFKNKSYFIFYKQPYNIYGHFNYKSDNKLFTKGIDVLKNIRVHFGHLKFGCCYGRFVY